MDPAPQPPRRGETWTFWLGVSSLTCLGPVTGVLAVLLGAVVFARAAKGARPPLAVAGIIAGAFGTAAGIVALVAGAALLEHRQQRSVVVPASEPIATLQPPAVGPMLPPGHPPIGSMHAADDEDDELPTRSTRVGTLTLVEVNAGERRSLRELLQSYRLEQAPLLVYVRASRCAPCTRFEAALSSAAMQTALASAVLVAVDASEFEGELASLRIDAHDVPTFVRIGNDLPTALDAITGVEWDDDTPKNMAPVFTQFLAGTLRARREPPPFVGTSL